MVEYAPGPLFRAEVAAAGAVRPWCRIVRSPAANRVAADEQGTLAHAVTLTGLAPHTLYHFRVQSRDPTGLTGTATTRVSTFTTD